MNELTRKVIDFCKDATQIFFPLDSYGGNKPLPEMGHSKRGFIKVSISQTLIGLAVTHEDEFSELAASMKVYIEFYGYYSTNTGKLYFKDETRYMAEFWDEEKNRPGRYLEYEPLPYDNMAAELSQALTDKFRIDITAPAIDVDHDDIDMAKDVFFDHENFTAAILPADIRDLMTDVTRNAKTEQYLSQPDAWLREAVSGMLAKYGTVLYTLFKNRLAIQTIIELLKQKPQHPWNRAKRLALAVAGKTTVTVTIKHDDGPITFRMQTFGLSAQFAGQYSCEYAVPKDRNMLHDQYHLNTFSIAEVMSVMHNGKEIFQT